MKIPLSALAPFGYTGIPSVVMAGDAVGNMMDVIFNLMVKRSNPEHVDEDSSMFCDLVGEKIIQWGASSGTVTTGPRVRNSQGDLLAIAIEICYTMPDNTRYTKNYQINPCGYDL